MKLALVIIHSINLTQYSIYVTSWAIVLFLLVCHAVFISYLNDLIYMVSVSVSNHAVCSVHKLERITQDAIRITQ